MQALRRLCLQAGLLGHGPVRTMATTPQIGKAGGGHGNPVVDNIGMMVVIPLAFVAIIYDYYYPEEEYEGKTPYYPYMRMRTREDGFPWGPDGLLEYHRHVQTDDD